MPHLYVEDADAVTARAVAAGASLTMPVAGRFWGDRHDQLEDPFGHRRSVATPLRDLMPEQVRDGMAQGMRDAPPARRTPRVSGSGGVLPKQAARRPAAASAMPGNKPCPINALRR